jgi:predicted ATP-dependent serine protease
MGFSGRSTSKYSLFWLNRHEISLKRDLAFGTRMAKGRKHMKKEHVTTKQSNINFHGEKQFSQVLDYGLKHGGVHIVASKGHGKSRLLFSIAKQLRSARAIS